MWEFCRIELVYSSILLISSINIGFVISYPYASTNSFIHDLEITSNERRLFRGITYMTAISGPYICDFAFHYFRRKTTLIIFMGINTILWFILPSLNKKLFWIGYIDRALIGIVLGALSMIVPIYLIELTSKENSGFFGSLYQFAVFFGVVTCELIGNYLDWKAISYVGGGICLFFLFMIWFNPDSPVVLSTSIDLSTTQTNSNQNARPYNSIFYCEYIKKLIYGIILFFFQNFTGVAHVILNIPDVFKLAGIIFPDTMAYSIALIISVFFSFIGCFIHHSYGRKIPWIISSAGIFISLIIQTIFLKVVMPNWIPFMTHFLFIAFFSLSLASYPYFALAELFPSSVRSVAVAVGCSASWTFTFLNFLFYELIKKSVGEFVLMIFFICLALFSCTFGFFFVDKPDLKSFYPDSYHGIEIDEE